MTYKTGFEPKDARTIHSYDQDDELDDFDDWSLESIPPRPRRQRKTGTQALVEFLNTTSPEEFQKAPPIHAPTTSSTKRRSTRFFLRRLQKNKSSSSSTSSAPSSTSGGSSVTSLYQQQQGVPHTIHRKNYIEIVTSHPPRFPQYYDPQGVGASRPLLTSTSKLSINEPILPNRRESSLHAPSIRSLSIHKSSTTTTTTPGITTACVSPTTPTMKSNKTTLTKNGSKDIKNTENNDKKRQMVDALVATCDGMDVIEAGLIQRLKQCQLYGVDKPMDVVSAQLTEEHIRALKVSAAVSASVVEGDDPSGKKKKGRTRHAQVQTMAPSETSYTNTIPTISPSEPSITNYTVEDLQRQLDEERQERQRLETALETTCDHFEVLSGLAYKKLRELWEENLRWENACVELNDKLLMAGHNNNNVDLNDTWTEDYQHSEYVVG